MNLPLPGPNVSRRRPAPSTARRPLILPPRVVPRRRRRDVKPFGPAAIASALLHVALLLAWLLPDLRRDFAEPLPPAAIEVVFQGGQPDRPAEPPPQPPGPPEPESPEAAPPPDAPPPPAPAPPVPLPPPPPPPPVLRPPPPAPPAAPVPVARPPDPAPPPPPPPAPVSPPAGVAPPAAVEPPAAVADVPPPPPSVTPAPPAPVLAAPEPPPPTPVRPEAPPIELNLPPAVEFTLPPPTPLALPLRPQPPPRPAPPRVQPRPDPNAPIYLPDGFAFERPRPPSPAPRPPGRQLDTSVSPELLGRLTPDPQLQVRGAQVGPDWRNAFRAWLDANMRYPEDARVNGVEGNVRVRIIADPDGTVRGVRLLRSSNSLYLDHGTQRPFRPGVRIPPFPPGADPRGVEIDLEVRYTLIRR